MASVGVGTGTSVGEGTGAGAAHADNMAKIINEKKILRSISPPY
jgi:hypothetical protein